jgi:hypothetical protein
LSILIVHIKPSRLFDNPYYESLDKTLIKECQQKNQRIIMLKRIEISNFKAIQDKTNPDGSIEKRPLILDNLASVNYLVGPNG